MNIFEFDREFENEFAVKIGEISAIYQPEERLTLDGQWTYDELFDNIRDECMKSREYERYIDRAMFQPLVLNADYMAELIRDSHDIIEVYNTESAKDRSKYGISMFDRWIHKEISNILKNNLVGR